MRTVVDGIAVAAGGAGTLTVLGAGGEAGTAMPWAAVHDRARRMATVLAGAGVGRGSRVGVLGDSTVDLVAALQAVWLRGAAVTVLPAAAGPHRAIVADARLNLVVADGAPDGVETEMLPLAELVASAAVADPAPVPRPDPADLALLQYTSGSTRTPRGVPVTHRHLAANIAGIKQAIGHDALHPCRTLSWLPLCHDMGLVGFLALPMSCGCPLLLQSPAAFARRPASWLETLSRYRIGASGAPNFAYRLMSRLLVAGLDVDLTSVRFLLSGGEPIDPGEMAGFTAAAARTGLDPAAIVPAYGLAESVLAVTVSPRGAGVRVDRVDADRLETEGRAVAAGPAARARDLVRLGFPVEGTEVRIVDKGPVGARTVCARTVGHVEVRGPSVVGHHWGDPPPPAGTWLRTGDLGYLTGDGELVVCGRAKDVLFAAGRNIFPQDIEAAAAEVRGVRPGGVAAFGVPGEQGDRLVVAVESRAADRLLVRHGVAAAVVREIGLAPAAVVGLSVGRLPKTSSGKLRRAEARRRYLSGEWKGLFDDHSR